MKGFTRMGVGGVVLAAACASGGGGVRQVTEMEAEVMGALFGATWVLDESASSLHVAPPRPKEQTFTVVVASENRRTIPPEVQAAMEAEEARQAVFGSLMGRRPTTLALRVDGGELVYAPTPGQSIALPINGGSATQYVERQLVRTRVRWDGVRLEIVHQVGPDGRVREVLEVVDARLTMTRTIRIDGETVPPMVLVYDREG